jgi:hypothetical protein
MSYYRTISAFVCDFSLTRSHFYLLTVFLLSILCALDKFFNGYFSLYTWRDRANGSDAPIGLSPIVR